MPLEVYHLTVPILGEWDVSEAKEQCIQLPYLECFGGLDNFSYGKQDLLLLIFSFFESNYRATFLGKRDTK